jgi:hypothetical protein
MADIIMLYLLNEEIKHAETVSEQSHILPEMCNN